MQKIRNYLIIAGTINFLVGIFALSHIALYSISLFITGTFFLYLSKQDEEIIKKNKILIFILSIIFIFINFITSIFLFICSDRISEYEKKNRNYNQPLIKLKKVIDPEMKKIDTLLKLGVSMVFLSAILFTTTSWNFLPAPGKIIGLLLFGCIFLVLSFVTEKKLKIYHSSYVYWILSMLFFFLIVVGSIYFKMTKLTYYGDFKYLSYFITFFTLSGLSTATYLKFSKNYLLYIVYTGILLSVSNFLLFLVPEPIIVTILISSLLLVANILVAQEKILYEFSKIVSYLMIAFIIKNDTNQYLSLTAILINLSNLSYLPIKQKFNEESFISLILIYALVIYEMMTINIINTEECCLIAFLITSFYNAFIRLKYPQAEAYNKINYLIYSILTFTIYLVTYEFQTGGLLIFTSSAIINITVSLIYLLENVVLSLNLKKETLLNYLQPISIFLLISSIVGQDLFYLQKYSSFSLILSITTIIYCIIHFLCKKNKQKEIYLFSTIIGIILGFLVNKNIIPAILTFLSSTYLFYINLSPKEIQERKLIISYALFIASLYNIIVVINILSLSKIITSIIIIWCLSIINILNNKSIIKKMSFLMILIPIYDIIKEVRYNTIYKPLMISIMILYITFLLSKFILTKAEDKNVAGLIGIILSIVEVFFISNYIIGIYIGILGIITIIIGYYNKNYKNFFNVGILITILNIVYQLKIWTQIPFWLYLLLAGLSIIGFVTYKELNKKNKE